MRLILCFLVLFIVAVFVGAARFRCDYNYNKAAGGYFKFHEIPATWHEARLRCHHEGSNLASPLTPEIMSVMLNITQGSECGVFTGIHSIFSQGDYHSIEGVPLAKIPHVWAKGEPDNEGDKERCIVLQPDGSVADASCSETLPYVCYEKASKSMVMNSCGTNDNEYILDSKTGSCYKFHKIGRTWSRAHMICSAEGGHLAIINSDAEAEVIRGIFAKNPAAAIPGPFYKDSAYIGVHDWNERGEFLTIDGQSLAEAGYSKWSAGEPNNATGGQYCGAIYRNALLDDYWCDRSNVFFCEKSPDSLLCDHERRK